MKQDYRRPRLASGTAGSSAEPFARREENSNPADGARRRVSVVVSDLDGSEQDLGRTSQNRLNAAS